MIRKNGKAYVVVEFDDEAMAEKFEGAIKDRYLPGVEQALVAGRAEIGDEGLSLPHEVNVTNNSSGPVTGTLLQAGFIRGKRVR